jgi:predicted nuclease of restriction endonuclease-like RecB superfamily
VLSYLKKSLKNKFETKIYRELKKAKVSFTYETERIPYVLAGHYIPDFIILTRTGVVYIETKGYLRPEAKRKMVAIKKQHPELDIRILFYSENKKYIKWAEKAGFKYAVDTIPKEWLDGF